MNSGRNDNNGIHFADQKKNIIFTQISFRYNHIRAKIKLLPVFGRHFEFRGKGITIKG